MAHINLVTPIPGPKSQAVLERRKNALPNGLAKSTEVVPERAEGGVVWDIDGNRLLDFAGGIGVMNLGHSNEVVRDAMRAQLDKYVHVCALVATPEPYIELAELLNSLTPGDFPKKTLLACSGSEAVESAVMVSKYFTKRPGVICFEGGYHGRTMLTLSLTSKHGLFKRGFGSFASDIYRLPAPNVYRRPEGMGEERYVQMLIDNLDRAFISQIDPSDCAAILIEPVQGEGGFIPMPKAFLAHIREVCDKYGIVMIADEIQCGAGRTGKLFAMEHYGIAADLVCMAKSIGSGMPISAVTGRADIMDAPHLGGVGGTYGGHPLSAISAIETMKILSSEAFLGRTNEVGDLIRKRCEQMKEKYRFVGDVRGLGAMRLIEFVKDRDSREPDPDLTLEIIRDAVSNGLLMIRAGLFSNCIRLLPPIAMTDEQLHEGLDVLEAAIARAHSKRDI